MDLDLDCSFLPSSGAMSCSCASLKFVAWFRDHTRKSTIHHLLWHVWKYFRHFLCVQEGPGTHSFRFFSCLLVRFFGTRWAQIFRMPNSSVRMSWTVWWFRFNRSFWLWNVDQTSPQEPSLWWHFPPFLTCEVLQNEVRLPRSHGHAKMIYVTYKPVSSLEHLSISPF